MRVAVVSRGFTSKQADQLLKRRGFHDLKDIWEIFDRNHETLVETIGEAHWQHIPAAVTARNQLVHGQKVFGLAHCDRLANQVLTALTRLHAQTTNRYGRDPWEKIKVRLTARLQGL
jgi:hypothetical protein